MPRVTEAVPVGCICDLVGDRVKFPCPVHDRKPESQNFDFRLDPEEHDEE